MPTLLHCLVSSVEATHGAFVPILGKVYRAELAIKRRYGEHLHPQPNNPFLGLSKSARGRELVTCSHFGFCFLEEEKKVVRSRV